MRLDFLALVLKNSYILSIEGFCYILSIEIFSYIFSKKSFYYDSKSGTLQFSDQTPKRKELHPRKIYYTSGNGNTEKTAESCSYVSVNRNPQKFFIFQETEISYISRNETF